MDQSGLESVFEKLSALLKKHSKGLDIKTQLDSSTAKVEKRMLGLVGKQEVAIRGGSKPQIVYVAGIILHKAMVTFYSMPFYTHPGEFELSLEMKKRLKGKSCFYIKDEAPETIKELDRIIKKGVEIYRREGWI